MVSSNVHCIQDLIFCVPLFAPEYRPTANKGGPVLPGIFCIPLWSRHFSQLQRPFGKFPLIIGFTPGSDRCHSQIWSAV